MHGRGIRLDLSHNINWLIDRLGPFLSMKCKCAAGLRFGYKHSVQANIDNFNAGRKIFNITGHTPLEAVLTFDMKCDGNFLSRFKRELLRFRCHHHIGRRNNRRELQLRRRVFIRALQLSINS